MRRHLRIFGVQLRTSVAQAMAYRGNFLLQGMMSFVGVGIALLPLLVLFGERNSVAGWDWPSTLIVMAYFIAIKAMMEGLISPSLTQLVEGIRTGSFDYILLKPMDAQLMISASRYEPWHVFDLLAAVGIAIYAFTLRGTAPALADVGLGLLLFVAGVLAMYSLWIICAAAAFWVVRLDNLIYLLGAIFDTARWPVQVFRGAWRLVFTFVIPIAVMTTFPAMALLGQLDARTALATIGGALLMLAVSRLVWSAAIRNYTSASS